MLRYQSTMEDFRRSTFTEDDQPSHRSNGSCSVHEWVGQFRNESVNFKMISVCGHVMSLDFIGKYNNWDKGNPVELFSCPTEKKEAVPKLKIPSFLAKEAVQQGSFRKLDPNDIWRAKFSAITDKDIKAAMGSLIKPNENEARSVDARQELDLRIGCAFTRFQTKFFQGKYGDLDSSLISYGPCQTPTLGFCVQRHDEIQTFKPDPYWVLQVSVKFPDGQDVCLSWSQVRSFDKEVASIFLSHVKEHEFAIVSSIHSSEKTKARPVALNTVELMRVASSGLETTSYPENFDLLSTLRQQQNNSDWGDEVRKIISSGISRPKKGNDAGDHPPITPMRSASRNELDGDAWRLYDYITRDFIATLARDCKYLSTTVKIEIGMETFTVTGHSLIDPGYTSLLTWQALSNNESLPRFSIGDSVKIGDVKLAECFTQPPDYLTESEKLVPTSLGIVFVHSYQKIDPELVLPTMRSAVEEQLNLIAVGRADFYAVLQHTVEIFKQKFQYFVLSIEAMDQLFEVSFSPLAASGKSHSRCGKCRRYMKYIQSKPSRLHCSHCNETYNVPQNGNIRI
ncbi:hypothetical protein QAD02_011163 [Eretmocerus hayati]|uniref:Uncharacterized protein n=1 Tax=Eretmocerus hayati TaxID=131215 RepID=A0ACC2NWB1_9HYME|nr:hypothetical protein QAD02_011163 [Eretmocerus hayati]